jgi:hypothetical protein
VNTRRKEKREREERERGRKRKELQRRNNYLGLTSLFNVVPVPDL